MMECHKFAISVDIVRMQYTQYKFKFVIVLTPVKQFGDDLRRLACLIAGLQLISLSTRAFPRP